MQRTREKTCRAEALGLDQAQCVEGTKGSPEVEWQKTGLKRTLGQSVRTLRTMSKSLDFF